MSTDVKDATRVETKNVQQKRLATAQASSMPQLRLPDAHALLVYLPSSEKYAAWKLSARGKAEFATNVVAISYQVVPPAPYDQIAVALVLSGKVRASAYRLVCLDLGRVPGPAGRALCASRREPREGPRQETKRSPDQGVFPGPRSPDQEVFPGPRSPDQEVIRFAVTKEVQLAPEQVAQITASRIIVLPWTGLVHMGSALNGFHVDITRSGASTADQTIPPPPELGSRTTFPIYDRRQGLVTDTDPCRTISRIEVELAASKAMFQAEGKGDFYVPSIKSIMVYFYLGSMSAQGTLNGLAEGATLVPQSSSSAGIALTAAQASKPLMTPAPADQQAYSSYAIHGANLVGDVGLARSTDYPETLYSAIVWPYTYALTHASVLRKWNDRAWQVE